MSLRPLAFITALALTACRTDGKVGGDSGGATEDGGAARDDDGDGYTSDEDCNDSDASVNPGATEVCDEVDNDCDGATDEDVATTYYADADGDSYGDVESAEDACAPPADYVTNGTDCDDADADSWPGATERCDEIDNDCDGEIDEDVLTSWYLDADSDGYGDPDEALDSCDPGAGYVADGSDCNDASAVVFPGAEEVCDELDNDCDGDVDEDVTTTYYADGDADGWGDSGLPAEACVAPTGYATAAGDCDDAQASVNPDAAELCNDVDDDCDGDVDEDDADDAAAWFLDADADGFGDPSASAQACDAPSGYIADDSDCDDAVFAVNPDATEVCDAIDNDCDGAIDDADADLDSGTASAWYADTDADGYGDAGAPTLACDQPSGTSADATDCDDTAIAVNPAATEICDTIDNDCDGAIDDADAGLDTSTGSTWYADADADGYGDAGASSMACDQPSGSVSDATDCDDGEGAVNPGATEICNGVDDDCDGDLDDADASLDASSASSWYDDDDGDGYGDASTAAVSCTAATGTVSDASDCDDTDAAVSPAGVESCNSVDDDCDGSVDEADAIDASTWYADTDADGYGDAAITDTACDAASGYVADDSDCDDTDGAVNPGASEVCNGDDDNCDGDIDEGVIGSGADCAAGSCLEILDEGSSTGDGTYTLEGTSGAVFDAWCDMTSDGGGWTLIGSVVNESSRSWNAYAVWTDTTTFGSIAASQTADYKSEAFYDIPGDDFMVDSTDYAFAFDLALGDTDFATWVADEYDSATCNTTYYISGADWTDGLTTAEGDAMNLIVRPKDSNATCFPDTNETVMIGLQSASCCWVAGLGNSPNGQASWRTHDLSLLSASSMSTSACTAGTYPCNDNGYAYSYGSFCYDSSCKQTWAEMYVR